MKQPKNTFIIIISIISICLIFGLGYFLGAKKVAVQSESNQIFAIVDGETIRAEVVLPKIKEDLRQLEKNKYAIKKHAVEEYLLEKDRAANQAKTATIAEAPQYTKEELEKFVKDRNINLSKLNIKAREDLINNFIIHKKMLAQKTQSQTDLKARNIEWLIPMTYLDPPVNVAKGFLPDLGSAGSDRKMIVFANYHCPYCKEANNKINLLKEKYKDKISVQFRFSMQEPESSMVFLSALAAGCANDQKKFAEYHQELFNNPPMEVKQLSTIAESLGLNMKEFTPCLESMKHKKDILADTAEAEKLGFNSQAMAFVNGHMLQIQEPLETFEAILNQQH